MVGQTPAILQDGKEKKIDILVENMGRINFGRQLTDERKGMEDCIIYSGNKLFGYDTRTLPLEDLSGLEWKENSFDEHKPCFFKGRFDAKSGIDTYISFENLDHGYIWVNGFNVGRYDSAGPQMTLYLPGHFLKDTDNELIVLDIDPCGERKVINFLDHEILEGDSRELN
jgi:beta-galactosidase